MRLFAEVRGEGAMTAVLLPFLGGEHTEWRGVVDGLRREGVRTVCVDLPGFGGSTELTGYSVGEMAESVLETLEAESVTGGRFVLVGHSMGAKVSAVVARWAADGDMRGRGLEGLVLVAGSPASPEPMEEAKREQMLLELGTKPEDEGEREAQRTAARRYVEGNAARAMGEGEMALAVEGVLRMNRAAWRAWLEAGSREDWSERVGVLGLPVLLVAGSEDEALGEAAQHELGLPQWADGRLEMLEGAHLLPLERPRELTDLLVGFVGGLGERRGAESTAVPMDAAYQALLASERVSEATRRALEPRAEADDWTARPQAMTVLELARLRAVVDRVVPQAGTVRIDLGGRLDRQLAERPGDGWRFADLPEDAEAWRQGLQTLEWHARAETGTGWLALTGEEQDGMLQRAQAGTLSQTLWERVEAVGGAGPDGEPPLSGEQVQRWFEDLRAEATKAYLCHPATLDRMGYSGIADGAESRPGVGFVQIGRGEVESWEPALPAGVGGSRQEQGRRKQER